ncbi:MAG: hypothetical protein FJ303_13990 [Planctomycetes bacterium]|nr:hypothetical protein [Planctomycetota bacterium]
MLRIFLVMLLGAGLFMGGAWYAGLLEIDPARPTDGYAPPKKAVSVAELGDDLYQPAPFPEIPKARPSAGVPTVLYGVMNPIETQEVPSEVGGKIWFVGDQIDESVVLAAGSAAFLAEPYYPAKPIKVGADHVYTFYRRHYEGQTVSHGQMLGMIGPAKAIADIEAKQAKIDVSIAKWKAAISAEAEGHERFARAYDLYFNRRPPAISKEELGAAKLTYEKLKSERIGEEGNIIIAKAEKKMADTELHLHELHVALPYKLCSIKTIVRQAGYAVKQGDPVIVVQNLERLQAEALIEEQYFADIKNRIAEVHAARTKDHRPVTATIEPTILEKPAFEFPGHDLDVTSVAVASDLRIVSGSEDKSVCVWERGVKEPLWTLHHSEAVRVVVCSPPTKPGDKKASVCLAGCANGSIYLWNLGGRTDEPKLITEISKAHGENTAITALAFSPNSAFFASGGSDGSIRMWQADGGKLYTFDWEHGVTKGHEDSVTSLHFTPQCRLISVGRDKTLRTWILKRKGAVADRKAIANRDGNVPGLGVSPDGMWMLFDQGRTLKLYSVQTQTLKHTIDMPSNSTPFDTLALFSPDNKLILSAGAAEGRLQLWRVPEGDRRAFEIRQFATRDRVPVACAAFAPVAGSDALFAVSASGQKIYVWSIPTQDDIATHPIRNVPISLISHSIDPSTKQSRIGFEVQNRPEFPRYPNGRFEAGRPVTIVIE